MLKQAGYVNDELTFEVECINCRKVNTVSLKTYFHIKKDFEMPRMKPIGLKMPSNMNVMIVSMSRCGISWVVRELNMLHEKTFGKSISLRAEKVSMVEVTRTRFPVVKGWNNIYDVNPLDVLKTKDNGEKYDRVLIVKRKWETISKVHEIYYPDYLSEAQKVIWREKDKKMYDLVYGQEIDDPRCLMINLEDVNNYTVDTYNELMDFFNFPSESRPIIAPILAPERNSEAYSSILKKGQPLIERLNKINSFYEVTLDGLLQLKRMRSKLKIIPLEKVLIIGPNIHKRCHFSENILYAFQEKGIEAELLPLEKINGGMDNIKNAEYKDFSRLLPLSKALEFADMKNPDLIVIDEPHWYMYNDLKIPVFYVHREFKRPPKVYYPDVAFFWHDGVLNYFKNMFAPHWVANTNRLSIMPIAFDSNVYNPEKKTYKGINMLGGRESLKECMDMKELTHLGMIHLLGKELKEYIDAGFIYIEDPEGGLNDERYREILPACEALFVHMPRGQYTTRRMIEAMACKVVCFIIIENPEHRVILEKMGLKAGVHYVEIKGITDLLEYKKTFKYKNYKAMVEAAYKVVREDHTFLNRVDTLIEFYNEYALRNNEVFVE